jgi:hypothetical protein
MENLNKNEEIIDKSIDNNSNQMKTKQINDELEQKSIKIKRKLNELKNLLDFETINLNKTKLELNKKELELINGKKELNLVRKQFKDLIVFCHNLEFDYNLKSIQCQKHKQLINNNLKTIEDNTNSNKLLENDLKKEKLLIENQIKQLSQELEELAQKELISNQIVVEIPKLIESKKILELIIEQNLVENKTIKLEIDSLTQKNDILKKRNNAILLRLNKQLAQKQALIKLNSH